MVGGVSRPFSTVLALHESRAFPILFWSLVLLRLSARVPSAWGHFPAQRAGRSSFPTLDFGLASRIWSSPVFTLRFLSPEFYSSFL
jgi:hypothetical protein